MDENAFACVFDANGTMLRVTAVAQVAQPGYTVLGWSVTDIADTVTELELAASRSPATTAWSRTLKASGQPRTVIGSPGSPTSMATSCL